MAVKSCPLYPLVSTPLRCLLLLLLLIPSTATVSARVPAVIVFGDSSVDSGNNNVLSTVLKSNFRPYGRDFYGKRPTGRFSNGRIPPDFIAEAFGVKNAIPAYLDPTYNISDFATGVCFASAGTGYDNGTAKVLNVMPLWKEAEYFKDYQVKLGSYVGEARAREIISEALYLVSLGTNDFLENYYSVTLRRLQYPDVRLYEDFLLEVAEAFFRKLYGLGARKFSLTGLPPMGCLPLERVTNFFGHDECVAKYNEVALGFNGKLEKMVERLNGELAGFKMVFANSYGILDQIFKDPSKYGFEVANVACCSTGTFEMSYLCNQHNPFTCTDASKYVFWDAFHPTEKTNQIVAQAFIPTLLREFS